MALAAVALVLAPASAGAVGVGIADQKTDVFADGRFDRLGIRHARIAIGWDAMRSDWQRTELEHWLSAARKAKVTPLISFQHSREPGRRRVLPKPEQLRREMRRIRKGFPWVKTFAAWNEANHCGEPTCHRAPLVAAYYRALRKECRECAVLPAELLDMPNMVSWTRKFLKANKGVQPKYWGLHNYVGVNRFDTTSTERLLREVSGDVWLTEVGGLVKRRNATQTKRGKIKRIPESTRHSAEVMRFLFAKVVPLSPRIKRVYVYHWNARTAQDSWDSALVSSNGKVRPAYRVLRARVHEIRQLRRTGKRR